MITPIYRLTKLKAVKKELESIVSVQYLPAWSLDKIREAIAEIDSAIVEVQYLVNNQ